MAANKILFIDQPHPFLIEKLTALGFQCDVKTKANRTEVEAIIAHYEGIFIRSRIALDNSLLFKAKRLRFVARAGAGIESIDTDYAKSKGIQLLTSPEGNRDAVGEHALGMLLMLCNHLHRANQQIKKGLWLREQNRGLEIKGKTIGIVGYGNMGRAFAQRLQGFECQVIAYDKYKAVYGDIFAKRVSLDTLFKESDVVSFHIPWMPDNHFMVNDAYLSQFKKNIYLINTARGNILKTADLVKHLKSGHVLGAALDVLEYEGISFEKVAIEDFPEPFQYLIQADNVVLSPHVAGWTVESKLKHAQVLFERITKLMNDKT